MTRFVQGAARGQSTVLPECLDDWLDEDNPVRAINAFVDALELVELGFAGVGPAATGRPSYHGDSGVPHLHGINGAFDRRSAIDGADSPGASQTPPSTGAGLCRARTDDRRSLPRSRRSLERVRYHASLYSNFGPGCGLPFGKLMQPISTPLAEAPRPCLDLDLSLSI
jgi:hypothetical protein